MPSKNIKKYIYCGAVILIFAIVYFLIYPSILGVRDIQKEVVIAKKTLEEKKSIAEDLQGILTKYNAKEEDFKKLDGMVSPSPDLISLLIQFDKLALESGVIMEEISFEKLVESSSKNFGVFPVNLKISGSYDCLKNYLEAIAKNLSLMDVETVEVSGDSESMSFSLKVNTYTEEMPEVQEEEKEGAGEESEEVLTEEETPISE